MTEPIVARNGFAYVMMPDGIHSMAKEAAPFEIRSLPPNKCETKVANASEQVTKNEAKRWNSLADLIRQHPENNLPRVEIVCCFPSCEIGSGHCSRHHIGLHCKCSLWLLLATPPPHLSIIPHNVLQTRRRATGVSRAFPARNPKKKT